MLPSLFASIFCTAMPAATPLEFPAQRADGRVAAQVGIHVTPTHLTARNFGIVPELLVFRDVESGAQVLRALRPGATLEWSFVRESLEFVRLEVMSVHQGAWHYTGLLDLSGALVDGAETFWIQDGGVRSTTWIQSGNALVLAVPEPTTLPDEWHPDTAADDGFSAAAAPNCAPTHVPAITPSDKPKGDAPPKLEDRPLPPV